MLPQKKKKRAKERENKEVPASNNLAAIDSFNKVVTLRTSDPLPLLRQPTKSQIIQISRFSAFFAPKTSVPSNLTIEAKEAFTIGTKFLLQIPTAFINNQSRTIPIWTITLWKTHQSPFAQNVAPSYKQFFANQFSTRKRFKELTAIQSGAGDYSCIIFEFGLDVLDHAIGAKRVATLSVIIEQLIPQ